MTVWNERFERAFLMRKLYLVRHGEPAFPNGEKVCLGQMDLPLSTLGRLQACLAGRELGEKGITRVFSSPLCRARETAAFLAPEVTVLDGLEEISTGEWDGLPFEEIRRRWPELYARRRENPLLPMPGGEEPDTARKRFAAAVDRAQDSSRGDIALVTHAQVMDLFCAQVLGRPFEEVRRSRVGYGACLCLIPGDPYTEEARITPRPALDRPLCLALLDAAETPEPVRAHCLAVAEEALRIAAALPPGMDVALLEHGALLHDIARAQADHARTGAAWLRALGYDAVAALIQRHHDRDGAQLDEAAVLHLADKCVQGTKKVSLAARFAASAEKCRTPEARTAHERRYQAARALQEKINELCQREIVR